jgi:hypothetical protein
VLEGGAALGIHAIGNALAVAEGLEGKHAVEQVGRLLSNRGIRVWDLFANWVPHIAGDRPEIVTRSTGPTSTPTTSPPSSCR